MTKPVDMIGKHTVQSDGDVVSIVLEGTLSSAEVIAIHGILWTALQAEGRCFVLIDITRLASSIGPEISRFLTDWHQAHRLTGAVIINDSPLLRGALGLIVGALEAVLQGAIPITVMANEAAARTWVSEQRQALLNLN